jgi:hypothetical protein
MATKAKSKKVKVIVRPATDNAYKEGYAKANGKIIPFDIPVVVDENDVKVLESIKEPKRIDSNTIDVHRIMDDLQITQEKANRIARMSEKEGMTGEVNVRYVPKYFVRVV